MTQPYRTLLAWSVTLCLAAPVGSAHAAPPPSWLDLGPDAARPTVPGERAPPTTARLPEALPKAAAKPKPKPKKKAPKPPPVRKEPVVPEVVPSVVVRVDSGRVSVPRNIVGLAAQVDRFPDLVGYSVDVAVLRPVNAHHAFGARLGLLVPLVPAANWYLDSDTARRPVYTELDVVGLDLAFEYEYRRRVIGPVGFHFRGGIGLLFALGSVVRTETLPICERADWARCPHWRRVGQQPDALPSPVWPALRATTGLFVDLGDSLTLSIDGGVRDALYLGAGIAIRR